MIFQPHPHRTTSRPLVCACALLVLLASALGPRPVLAQTYVSAEPIPSSAVVGDANLAKIESLGYTNLELWSQRLLNDCHLVQSVIESLSAHGAITTVTPWNTRYLVAAGGFQAVTDPSYVFTMQDSGPGAVSAADVTVLDNALGYVLNQGGTAQFSPYNQKAYDFSLDYALVTLPGVLTGEQAKEFFDHLGTIDPALWSGTYAGFTQIDAANSPLNNSMLFLKPAAPKREFIDGLYAAATTTPYAMYTPLGNNGQPTTAKAGIAFPGNDWITHPNGDGYLANLGNPSAALLTDLASLRRQHLQAVSSLLSAIDRGNVGRYLNNQFRCPK
jgi:hypothetical protein